MRTQAGFRAKPEKNLANCSVRQDVSFEESAIKTVLIFVALCSPFALWAGPAPWYKWHSNSADYDVCSQISPGDGWEIVKGPFQDSHCQKPGMP